MALRRGEPLPAEVDLAILGAGGAGQSLLVALAAAVAAGGRNRRVPSVVVVDPVRRRGDDRTWCFWDHGVSPVESAVTRSWDHLALVGPDGDRLVTPLVPLRYAMVRSSALYALADRAAERLGAVRVEQSVRAVHDLAGFGRPAVFGRPASLSSGALVELDDGRRVRARWVADSRPVPPRRPGGTLLWQQFLGRVIPLPVDVVDPEVPVLMDFSVPQPPDGVAFCYLVPLAPDQALVEYTELTAVPLDRARGDAVLRWYVERLCGDRAADRVRWGAGGAEEEGRIPMTDGVFPRRPSPHVLRIGTAGGATRASTGYTFSAIQRQVVRLADDLITGRRLSAQPAYPRRHRWLDGMVLRVLAAEPLRAPELFLDLFRNLPAPLVLGFLDGRSTLAEELAIMRAVPRELMAPHAGLRRGRIRSGTGSAREPGARQQPGPLPWTGQEGTERCS